MQNLGAHCSAEECDRPAIAKGLCAKHYQRAKMNKIARHPKKSGPHPVPTLTPIDGMCGVEGCGRPLKQKGMCSLHHGRMYHYGAFGDPNPRQRFAIEVPCSVEGCERLSRGRGLCATHYRRLQVHGDPGEAELRTAQKGEGTITATGYRKIVVNGESVFEHRHVMAQKLGRKLPPNANIHHIDGDKLNNDPSNLELWTTQQPAGQRVADRMKAAIKLIREHPDFAAEEGVRLISLESQESTDLLRMEMGGAQFFENGHLGFGE